MDYKKSFLVFIAFNLLFCLSVAQNTTSVKRKAHSQTDNSKASRIVCNGHSFDVYAADYPGEKIQMFWKGAKNEKLGSIANVKTYTDQNSHKLVFATNAGMYMADNTPLGLYVENGKELRHINLSTHETGNFYLQPNGVFLLTETQAMVITSAEYNKYKGKAIYATQSGPMLVTNGAINANFTKGSSNINIRSGVGISADGKVVFAISDELVNFYDFARFFKDNLHCNNALFLDGAISRMYLPGLNRFDTDGSFGAMIGIVK